MRCVVTTLWLPRHGSPAEHYEDAFCPRRNGPRATPRLRLAVADGASESMLSGLWAELLVRTWCRARRRALADVVASAMSGWETAMKAYLEGREAAERPIEWFERPGLERGAHAALLGVELVGSNGRGRWSASSLGDACLFQVRDDELVASFPMEKAAAFGNAPKLVPTHAKQLERVVAHGEHAHGGWRAGDVLFLTTDALAAWFLSAAEAGGAPWRALSELDGDGFASWAAAERGRGLLRNDDLTLVRVEVGR